MTENLFSHSSGGWKFEVRMPTGPGSGERSLPYFGITNLSPDTLGVKVSYLNFGVGNTIQLIALL